MRNLIELQHKLQACLTHADSDFESEIEETKKVSAKTRLQIYSNAYRFRLIDALSSSYPMLAKYLGEKSFQTFASFYIDQYPSSFRSIRWFGDQLALFLRSHEKTIEYPWYAELATLEWHMTLAFDAPDAEVMDAEPIMQIPPDAWAMMHFVPHPSVYLLDLQWNVMQIWKNLAEDILPPIAMQNTVPTACLVWRKDWMSQYSGLPVDEYHALDLMIKGHNFGEICDGLSQWHDDEDAALRAASLLKGWIGSGLISAVKTGE